MSNVSVRLSREQELAGAKDVDRASDVEENFDDGGTVLCIGSGTTGRLG